MQSDRRRRKQYSLMLLLAIFCAAGPIALIVMRLLALYGDLNDYLRGALIMTCLAIGPVLIGVIVVIVFLVHDQRRVSRHSLGGRRKRVSNDELVNSEESSTDGKDP